MKNVMLFMLCFVAMLVIASNISAGDWTIDLSGQSEIPATLTIEASGEIVPADGALALASYVSIDDRTVFKTASCSCSTAVRGDGPVLGRRIGRVATAPIKFLRERKPVRRLLAGVLFRR